MDYRAYIKRTHQAASLGGGKVESLAGGFYGVRLPADGCHVYLALDLDTSTGWYVWREDADGERCCDNAEVALGWIPSEQLSEKGFQALTQHKCERDGSR